MLQLCVDEYLFVFRENGTYSCPNLHAKKYCFPPPPSFSPKTTFSRCIFFAFQVRGYAPLSQWHRPQLEFNLFSGTLRLQVDRSLVCRTNSSCHGLQLQSLSSLISGTENEPSSHKHSLTSEGSTKCWKYLWKRDDKDGAIVEWVGSQAGTELPDPLLTFHWLLLPLMGQTAGLELGIFKLVNRTESRRDKLVCLATAIT